MKPFKHVAKGRNGASFALAAAVISGFSVYINKFAVSGIGDPVVFTTLKNLVVAGLLFGVLIAPKALPELRALTRRQWAALGLIGCVGGGVPFLLFFHGLHMGTAAGAALIHKTMFVWAAVPAVIFLGERIGPSHAVALAVLLGGSILLLGPPGAWTPGGGTLLVLLATLLWAVEAVIAKKVLAGMGPGVAAFGRMFFGSAVLLAYLAFSGKLGAVLALDGGQAAWTGLTALLLFGYVTCYYAGLKHAPVTVVTGIMVLGSLITNLLERLSGGSACTTDHWIGPALIACAVFALWRLAPAGMRQKSGEAHAA
ncbi:MAG: DMT family transporter [Thermodesulfobacteriota bacterium]